MNKLESMLVENGIPAKDAKVIATLSEKGMPLSESMKGTLVKNILGTLTIYGSTNVWLENGRYTETPHSMLRSSYAADHKLIATIKNTDIYTADEIKQHLVELSKMNWENF